MAEEIGPASFGASVLICQQCDNASLVEDILHFIGRALFIDHVLTVKAAKIIDVLMDVWVIQGANDCGGGESKNAGDETCEFEITKVAGDQDGGTIGDHVADHVTGTVDLEMISPIGAMDLARGLSDFAGHQEEVMPGGFAGAIDLLRGPLRKDEFEIVVDQFAANGDVVGEKFG
jgi:hypothetical protein